jgi:hypothetical protein
MEEKVEMITQIKERLHRLDTIVVISCFVLFLFSLDTHLKAEEEEPTITTETKEVQGEVSMIGRDYISVVYMRDLDKGIEYEMQLPIDEDLSFIHARDLNEIKVGDIVRVTYEEVTEEYQDESKTSRKGKVINFVKSAVREQITEEVFDEPVAEYNTDVLRSGEKIKGYKAR